MQLYGLTFMYFSNSTIFSSCVTDFAYWLCHPFVIIAFVSQHLFLSGCHFFTLMINILSTRNGVKPFPDLRENSMMLIYHLAETFWNQN